MVEEISIKNNTLNETIQLSKKISEFLLADDSTIDWGTIQTTFSTYSTVSRVGLGVNNIAMDSGRTITIIGWVINDEFGTIEEKKHKLGYFCNPFDSITLMVGKYQISGHFGQPIQYSVQNKENNEIVCKFLLSIFCENPLFTLIESEENSSYSVYQKSFNFPFVWLDSEPIVFGLRQSLSQFNLMNSGTLATGFECYLHINEAVTGIAITSDTTEEVFQLKPSVTFESGDIIYINTVFGQRTVKVGTSIDNLAENFQILDLSSDFIQLVSGVNTLSVSVISGSEQGIGADFTVKPLFYAIEEQ